MNESMTNALKKLFERYRIVFWYCEDSMLAADYEALAIDGVEKRDITGHPFAAKVEVLHERVKDKFLLFCRGARPKDEENFLLDVLLANAEFRTDKASLLAADLGLGDDVVPAIKEALGFFTVQKRVNQLKSAVAASKETELSLKRKMLDIAAGDADLDIAHILMAILNSCSLGDGEDESEVLKTVRKCGLENFFWNEVRLAYGYSSANPDIRDFILAVFRDAADVAFGKGDGRLATSVLAFLSDWRDNMKCKVAFERLSGEAADALGVERATRDLDWKDFGTADWFEAIDGRIVNEMVKAIEMRTVRHEEVLRILAERRNTHWFSRHERAYLGAVAASAYFSEMAKTEFLPSTADEAFKSYAEGWSKLDGFYREFTAHHHEERKRSGVLEPLAKLMDADYVTNCLVPMNNAFQRTLEDVRCWPFETTARKQSDFWRNCVAGEMANRKVCVIISDALRYGVARTLVERIRATDRYSAKLEPMVGMLPSYTQLGMAALLPHDSIAFGIPYDGRVLVDGKQTSGIADRAAILSQAEPKGATAVRSEDVLAWTKEQLLEYQRANRVIYVYHNAIDETGDARTSESQTCEACERAVEEIVAVIKKLAGPSHVSNFYVTSDHGFLYQDSEVEECDFIAQPVTREEIGTFKTSRRFFIGRSFITRSELMRFEEKELGLSGDARIAIPKSITKMRLAGAGSRFVHGGASLQEITIPLVTVSKSRIEDTAQVDIDILRSGVNRITTGQLVLKLYQMTPVGGKNLERTVRLGLRTQDGKTALSAQKEVVFKYDSESSAERIETITLPLNHQADSLEGQYVDLVIESKVAGTSQYVPYKIEQYLLKRSIIKDFD